MAFKIINCDLILKPNMLPKAHHQRPTRECNNVKVGPENEIEEPEWRLDIARKTFFFSTPKLWNDTISSSQANAPSVEAFKRHFNKNK